MEYNDLYWIIPGSITAPIAFCIGMYHIIKNFNNTQVDSQEMIGYFCGTIAGTLACFTLTGVILLFAILTSPIWLPITIRYFIIKKKLKRIEKFNELNNYGKRI